MVSQEENIGTENKKNDSFYDFKKNDLVSIRNLVKGEDKTRYESNYAREIKIEEEIVNREKIKNHGLIQDIGLKRITLKILLIFLGIETAIIFLISFFQAMKWPHGFSLEEWSFKLLISATIVQITIMLNIAVKHLFPHKK